jgi:hypothetical protein
MEEFRGLLNLEIPDKKFISFVLFGLPEIEDALKQDEPLNQRVAMRLRLGYMNLDSTEKYIKHRLKVAGATKMLFTREAVEEIQRYSRGIPRVINNICDNALLEGMLRKASVVGRAVIEKVADELSLTPASKEELAQIESHRVWGSDVAEDAAGKAGDVNGAQAPRGKGTDGGPGATQTPEGAREGEKTTENIDIDTILDSLEIE